MSEFQLALLIGAIITAAISKRLPRAHLWILAGAASFVASTAWARYGMPYPPAFTLAADSAVCLLIYFFGKERWEDKTYTIFQLSVLVSLVYLAGPIEIGGVVITMSHWLYVVMLEICNWAALAVIGGTALFDMAKAGDNEDAARYDWTGNLHRPNVSWRKARATQPFHKASK